jgi:hypothetical protein
MFKNDALRLQILEHIFFEIFHLILKAKNLEKSHLFTFKTKKYNKSLQIAENIFLLFQAKNNV